MISRTHVARLGRLLAESPATLAALAITVVVEVGLRRTTLPRLAQFLGAPLASSGAVMPPSPGGPGELPGWAQRRVRATRRVLRRWPFGDTCLRQALVSGQRLHRLRPQLHVGVAKVEGEIRAHAWLSIGEGILDPLEAAGSYLGLEVPRGGDAS